jgi:hypothetical protein
MQYGISVKEGGHDPVSILIPECSFNVNQDGLGGAALGIAQVPRFTILLRIRTDVVSPAELAMY